MNVIALIVGRSEEERSSYIWFTDAWKQALLQLDPSLKIEVYPEITNVKDVVFACVWKHPLGILNQFPNLKCIASLAAGVDHVLVDNDLPENVPIVRVMDPYMANDIVQYVTAYVLQHVKLVNHWAEKQKQKIWYKQPPFSYADKTIGIMGLGFLGSKAAHILQELGLKVIGWSRSVKSLPNVETYYDDSVTNDDMASGTFKKFLSKSDILICMLPLTKQTHGVLNKETFSHLPKGAYLINVGRGEHLVEEDLLASLATSQLAHACLDVFNEEPLPQQHPFWAHPNITVTPHIASVTNPQTAAPQLLENYKRCIENKTLSNLIDKARGY